MKKLLLILTLLTTTFATICADNVTPEKGYQLSGTVVDVDSDEPLAGAVLKVEGTNIVAGTNSKGEFTLVFGANKVTQYAFRVWVTPPHNTSSGSWTPHTQNKDDSNQL